MKTFLLIKKNNQICKHAFENFDFKFGVNSWISKPAFEQPIPGDCSDFA